ncbi:MAG TPA: cysteine--1-D-myo-inosityl 2-amino-2-deoxy-alpha-D-glucopyranoside ligase [Actinobacteria bacterium]|nr:cysteine--1-D-myo-inosityl 2-amino-2-deoxy-alpha-D-glucopyranoside ligase [Actinomycetota bacterium]
MRAWPSVELPRLPRDAGEQSVPMLFNTATGRNEPLTAPPGQPWRMYVCGITPYDAAHLGHAMTYVTFDLVQRLVRDCGVSVRYVQNVTDVDDPLLERALITGDHWSDLAQEQIDRFRHDMAALRVLPPDEFIGVVESMEMIAGLVERLRDSGLAYQVDDDWYFDIDAQSWLGRVSHLAVDQMQVLFAERGGDPARPGKRSALDPLLWRAHREGEPQWPAAVGAGRPGWHIGCVAIATSALGASFDLQGGGSDLVFPHHDMCSALTHGLDGLPFAKHFAHVGMVALDGEKMSKSKGNLEFVGALMQQGVDAMAIRLALLDHHYRSDWEWTTQGIQAAQSRWHSWRQGLSRRLGAPAAAFIERMRVALYDDLDAPRACQAVDDWLTSAGEDEQAPADMAAAIDALLGVSDH